MQSARPTLTAGHAPHALLVAQTLATEAVTSEYAHANDGLPHTLEHMIFLGSELYPYKGVLDQLANRCLAGVSCARAGVAAFA